MRSGRAFLFYKIIQVTWKTTPLSIAYLGRFMAMLAIDKFYSVLIKLVNLKLLVNTEWRGQGNRQAKIGNQLV
jgi:hypothetical protein